MFKTNLARENWQNKYQYQEETPLETQIRAAKAIASVENNPDEWEDKFLNVLVKFDKDGNAVGLKNTLGGRITANIGTEYGGTTLLNCFVNGPVSNARIEYDREIPGTDKIISVKYDTESVGDNLRNIMLTLLEQAETLKSEGGYGINFGFIRPRGTLIKSIGIRHPGVVHYMEIWDMVANVIVMGDNDGYEDSIENHFEMDEDIKIAIKKQARKGAQMAVLPIWHPDVEEFVRAKQEGGRLTKFNLSVLVDDKFLRAVENDDFYDLHFGGKTYKRVKASELYDLIMESTYNRAEPGILFYDNMQNNNPLSYLGPIDCANPCGEVGGNPKTSTVCLLGSCNLTQYVKDDRNFDWDLYKHDIALFARMLDNVNDLTRAPLPQYEWAVKNVRQYGMGINGLGSTLYMMGVKYNSAEAEEFVERVTSMKEDITWKTSALLAKEKGAFPAYNELFLETNWFKNFTKISEETKDLIRKYGVRNGKTTTNPPLGNSSVVCDMVSNAIEPVFDKEYDRTYIANKWPEGLTKQNVKRVLTKKQQGDVFVWGGKLNGVEYLYEPHNRGLCIIEKVRDYGYQWILDHYPEDAENDAEYLVTTKSLAIEDHVKIQSIAQRNCNQSISKTCNLPSDYSFEEFKNLYLDAWRSGLNGFTTYREGSMEAVLSTVGRNNGTREIIRKDIKLPDEFINGPMSVIKREGMKFYFHFSYLPEDLERIFPVALWLNTNSYGEIREANAVVKALAELLSKFDIDADLIEHQKDKIKGNPGNQRVAKMISMCLRHNIPIVNIVHILDHIPDIYVTDTIFAVKKFLSQHIEDGSKVLGAVCKDPKCKSTNIIYTGGCSVCKDCGNSLCG